MRNCGDDELAKARRHLLDGRQKFAAMPSEFARFDDPGADEIRQRLATVAHLLQDGRHAEAILFATLAAWKDLTAGEAALAKANFNPEQPRDEHHQRWVKEGGERASPLIDQIQYRGFYHNAIVDQLVTDFRKAHHIAEKDISILGINGVLAKPDIAVTGPDAPVLQFFELKTGFDPSFTANQSAVYPLICLGWHATSLDPRILKFGYQVGEPLPPLKIFILRTLGPGWPVITKDYCLSLPGRP